MNLQNSLVKVMSDRIAIKDLSWKLCQEAFPYILLVPSWVTTGDVPFSRNREKQTGFLLPDVLMNAVIAHRKKLLPRSMPQSILLNMMICQKGNKAIQNILVTRFNCQWWALPKCRCWRVDGMATLPPSFTRPCPHWLRLEHYYECRQNRPRWKIRLTLHWIRGARLPASPSPSPSPDLRRGTALFSLLHLRTYSATHGSPCKWTPWLREDGLRVF